MFFTIECYARNTGVEDHIPAILYSTEIESVNFSVSRNLMLKLINDGAITTQLLELQVNGKKYKAVVKDVQYNPINSLPVHIDFMPVISGKNQVVSVPLILQNKESAAGVKRGGMLFTFRRYLKLKGDLTKLPRVVVYDVKELNLGDKIRIKDLNLVKGFTFADKPETLVATISGKKKKIADEEATKTAAAK